ncbi:hypothetical protein [Rhodovarius sp.]|uniref:hypothetical protein n=1 Tax=Rhodovarius sp. TaxID=2972673 RepID=UPI0033418426
MPPLPPPPPHPRAAARIRAWSGGNALTRPSPSNAATATLTPVITCGFSLHPEGFFDENPAHDIPPSASKLSLSTG